MIDPEFIANGLATQNFILTPYFGFIPISDGSGGGSNTLRSKVAFYPDRVNACVVEGLKETGLSIGLDALGAIPAFGNMVSAGAATAHAINDVVAYGGGAVGIATSVSDKTPVGALSASAGVGLALADLSLGGTKAIPMVGNVLSGATGLFDLYRFNETVQACIAR